jgi:hypothetical protein
MAKLRIKSQWFRDSGAKTPQQNASAMAFITWRVAQNTLKQMRSARFDIEIGPQYFDFTREVLVFLTQVIDRLMGEPVPGQASHYEQFIDLFNELSEHYADFGFDAKGPDFAFVRYLGHRIEALMPQKDQRWVVDQIMASEVPDALDMIQRGMDGVLSTEPRPKRASRAGVAGD